MADMLILYASNIIKHLSQPSDHPVFTRLLCCSEVNVFFFNVKFGGVRLDDLSCDPTSPMAGMSLSRLRSS